MNFFARQNETRKLARNLVLLFIVAVIAVVTAVDLVIFLVIGSLQPGRDGIGLPDSLWFQAHPFALVGCSLAVLGIIGLASLYKSSVLAGGGGVVARSMGGVRVAADTTDPTQRKLLNIVEEMSLASGVPMPEVYVLEQESGINAFAAGHNPSNAAITVTRGALATLDRAELQGVIAHEFSHVLNGDMRINIRLMGLLFGLLVIAIVARTVLRFGPSSSNSRDRKGGGNIIMLAALAVMAIGYIGLFFGRLIQAAIARSRESLADASAVQFTRDPTGLRGALVKIGAIDSGSTLSTPQAEEAAHMFFAPGIARFFATHPDLVSRIKAIDPQFSSAEFAAVKAKLAARLRDTEDSVTAVAKDSSAERLQTLMRGAAVLAPASVSQLVGNPGTEHVALAQEMRAAIPPAIVTAGQQPATARALFLALALDRDESRERQLSFIAQQLGAQIVQDVRRVLPEVDALSPQLRIPAVLRSFPAMRQLTREERVQIVVSLNAMLQREGQLSVTKYALRKLAQVQLRDDLDPRLRSGTLALNAVTTELQVLFSVLAAHGSDDPQLAKQAYEVGVQALLPRERPAMAVPGDWARALDAALNRLDMLMPAAKEQLVEALLKTIANDGQLVVEEAELLRAVCASVHCPLPPLIQ